ncbi:MAG: 3-dehydroquinate synthase [Bacteroidota bacterium]
MMDRINAGSYSIQIGADALGRLEDFARTVNKLKKFILVDANTRIHCLPHLIRHCPSLSQSVVIEVPAGEACKTVESLSDVWKCMLEQGADRQSCLFICGGGAVCDLGGFAAATYHRGIPCHLIPTSLLAMVDASVGGKTAINLGHVKNPVGIFSMPAGVHIDPAFLSTLPTRELRSGLAEIFKHACLSSGLSFPNNRDLRSLNVTEWSEWIGLSVAYKQSIVAADPEDRDVRQLLNFGHTLGHAIEAVSLSTEDDHLLHGEAIALGMIGEIYLSTLLCGLPQDQAGEMVDWLCTTFHGLHWKWSVDELIRHLQHDKKRSEETVRFSLLKKRGEGRVGVSVGLELVPEAVDYIRQSLARTRTVA